MSKQKAMRNTGKRKYEMGSALNSMKTENITDTPIYLALNRHANLLSLESHTESQ